MDASTRSKNINNLIQPLLTDKYQISMCYAYWLDSKNNEPAVFDLFFRKNPFKGEYTIFAGLDECLKYLENFHYSDDDINYLKQIPDFLEIDVKFWDYLRGLNAEPIKLYALKEGSVCFPRIPLVRLEGPLGLVQLFETTLLNLINFASLMCTNAARYKLAAKSGNPDCKLLEFGLRRAQGPDGGFSASHYSYMGGFDATSNLLAGREFGIPVSGTVAHSFIMAYQKEVIVSYQGTRKIDRASESEHKFLLNKLTGKEENFTICCLDLQENFRNERELSNNNEQSELKAFIAFARAFPNVFLVLVDTYDVINSGLVNFCIVAMALLKFGYKPRGIRIDSGDLAYLSKYSKNLFNSVATKPELEDFGNFEIVASNDINEETIYSLNDQDHKITSMGIGTHLVTCQSQPALGCVCKLVEINKTPCMKLSSMPEKITMPSKKSAYRLYGKEGYALLDIIVMDKEPIPVVKKRILCRHPFIPEKRCNVTASRVEPLLNLWWDGKQVQKSPSLDEVRNHCIESLNYLTEDIKRSLNPTPYKVSVSETLFNLLNELKIGLTPIGELC